MTSDTLTKIYEELRALRRDVARREDVEALIDTQLISKKKETMRQLAASRRDKKAGRLIEITDAKSLLR